MTLALPRIAAGLTVAGQGENDVIAGSTFTLNPWLVFLVAEIGGVL